MVDAMFPARAAISSVKCLPSFLGEVQRRPGLVFSSTHRREWKPCTEHISLRMLDPRLLQISKFLLQVGGRKGRPAHRIAASVRHSVPDAATDESKSFPPSSREEAVEQAGAALQLLLEKTLRQQHGPMTVKERKAQRQIRLRVDIPLLTDSPRALRLLASDLLDSFLGGKSFGGPVAVFLPQYAMPTSELTPTRPPENVTIVDKRYYLKFLSLDGQENLPEESVTVLVVAPTFKQVGALDFVARSAKARPVIVINPEWSEEEEADKHVGVFLSSFCVAYSFMPLNIQGLFSKTEGAVVKNVRRGAPEGNPWLIFVKEGSTYKRVSASKKKPSSADLENALYGAVAANSPLSKSIMFLRGLVNK